MAELLRRTEPYLAAVILALCLLLTALTPEFLTLRNFLDLVDAYAVNAIFACGLLVVLVFGGIDISFAGTAAITQYVTGMVLVRYGIGWIEAFALAGALGLLVGFLNAALIHGFRLMSVIVTIANMSVFFGLLMYFTRGRSIYDLPGWFKSGGVLVTMDDGSGGIITVTLAHVAAPLAFLVTWLLLSRLRVGRQIVAHGGNPEAAQRLGCNIRGLHFLVYGYMGLLAGLAGMVQAYRVEEIVPNALIGRELDVLAAVVLGGASLAGGVGSVLGTLLGIVLLAVLRNGLTLMGVSSYAFGLVTGLVILGAVSATALADRARAQRTAGNAP
jgi:simple sugar transport system permease protein